MREFNPPFNSRSDEELILIAKSSIEEWEADAIEQAKTELERRAIPKEKYYLHLNKIYLRFNVKESEEKFSNENKLISLMKYILIKFLQLILPAANPDFENIFSNIKYWKIEFDLKENLTSRELGFDKNDNSIFAAPFRNNYGNWVDEHLTLSNYENFKPIEISDEEFEND